MKMRFAMAVLPISLALTSPWVQAAPPAAGGAPGSPGAPSAPIGSPR